MSKMNPDEALKIVSDILYETYKELRDGLPGGSDEEWGYDEELVIDIAKACLRFQNRKSILQDPYVVWFFNGSEWSVASEEMLMEDAYKEWYKLTCGAKKQRDSSFETYYHLDLLSNKPSGRHYLENDDDFSINYLLNKSFGD